MLIVAVGVCSAGHSQANNGLNLIGASAEGVAMGGADVAVARDTLSLAVNPAGLRQLWVPQVDALGGVAYGESEHADPFAGEVSSDRRFTYLGNSGVALPLNRWGLTIGAGLFAQGGSGVDYQDVRTAFGTRDELSTLVGIAKAAAAMSIQLSDRLLLGVSPVLFAADLQQKVFPNTSAITPAGPFFGFEVSDLRGFGAGARFGALYRATEWLTLGAAYATETDVDFEDGTLRADLSAIGAGKVRYRNARIDGFNVPREASLGAAVRPADDWLLALEVTWINWQSALGTVTLEARDPNDPSAPPKLSIPTRFDWRDQYVLAAGIAYQVDDALTLRAGYNYAQNPVPDSALNPLFAQTTKHHVTVGAGYRFDPCWQLNMALEYVVPNQVTYHNPDLPFDDRAREETQLLGLWLQLSYRWAK